MADQCGITGEEYFETNPNDSYEMTDVDNTNRDLMPGEDIDTSVPVEMRSPDVTQMMEQEQQFGALAMQEISPGQLNTSAGKISPEKPPKGSELQESSTDQNR